MVVFMLNIKTDSWTILQFVYEDKNKQHIVRDGYCELAYNMDT